MVQYRIDASDGKVYTYKELFEYYRARYTQSEIDAYWKKCAPVTANTKKKWKAGKAYPLLDWASDETDTDSSVVIAIKDSPEVSVRPPPPPRQMPDTIDDVCSALMALNSTLHKRGSMRKEASSLLALTDIDRPLALMDIIRPLALTAPANKRPDCGLDTEGRQRPEMFTLTDPTRESLQVVNDIIAAFIANADNRNKNYDRIYSPVPNCYGKRGGHTYYKPNGWSYYAIKVDNFAKIKQWAVAYHGTEGGNVPSILVNGLRRPGDLGIKVKHGEAGPRKTKSKRIYLSPSIYLASHPVYSRVFPMRQDKLGQIVFKCRVRPGSFTMQRNTLGEKHWDPQLRVDPNFKDNTALEWIFHSHEDIQLTGLMVREFGPNIDKSKYGDLPTRLLPAYGRGPEYAWVELLQEHHRQNGHFVGT